MNDTSEIRLIYATFPDMATARATARPLIEDRLAACVNMWPGMVSIYDWQGTIEESDEVVFLAKTTLARVGDVVGTIVDLHPYDEPAVLVLNVTDGSTPFLAWIRAQTGSSVAS